MTEKEMLELMKQALEPVHEKLTVLDTKMTSLDEKVNSLDAKVTSLDEKVNSLDTKVASLDAKVNSLDTKVASLDAKVNSLDADVRGIKVVLENEVRRDLNLLAEGHAAILERLPSQEEKEALEARMDAMEAAIRLHSKQIRELKKSAMRRPDRQSTPDAPRRLRAGTPIVWTKTDRRRPHPIAVSACCSFSPVTVPGSAMSPARSGSPPWQSRRLCHSSAQSTPRPADRRCL